jgi:hypothetical protein
MKTSDSYSSLLVASAAMLLLLAVARAEDSVNTIKFSDPTKPGTVKIILARGDLRVRGEDTAEVAVTSEAKPVTKATRKDGLRVLTSSTSFALTEKDNVITLDALSEGWAGPGANFRLSVPRATSIIVANSFGGDITCNGITGDVEIKSMNGEVTLTDLAGGALVDTMNGQIHANIQALHDGKPLSFTSMNGEVVLRVPADAKANVRLRTQNGAILTDFDDKALVTKTEAVARTPRTGRIRSTGSASRDDIHAAVREAVQAGVEAASEVAAAAREVAQAAREAASEARANGGGSVPPIPPMPPLPPMTGGRLVYGTLNGGGPEVSVTTMNGDVTLRQLEAKK